MASTSGVSSAVTGTSLDVNSIVSQLMVVEQQPLNNLVTKEAGVQAKISAYGTIKGALSTLQTTIQTLANKATFTTNTASSSSTSVVSATATTAASTGAYSLSVSQLATYNAVRSDGAYTATSETFNSGTLSIAVGSANAVNITIDSTNHTLAGIRDAINKSGSNVTASIINDGTYQRLVLSSNVSGTAGAITVTSTDSGSGGTHALTDFNTGGTSMVTTQPAKDAQFTLNGVDITRSSNTVSDVINGVTLTLAGTGSAAVSVGRDNTAAVKAINDFVTNYNAVVQQNKTLTSYDSTSQTASVLTGDFSVTMIGNQLANLLQTQVTGVTGVKNLADIGINLQKDGTLSLDTAKLTSALNNPNQDVASLFTQTTSGNQGIAVQFNTWLTQALGSTGIIQNNVNSLNATVKDIDNQRTSLQNRLTMIEANYRAQFTALDSLVSTMNQTSLYLTQQLANLPTISSSGK